MVPGCIEHKEVVTQLIWEAWGNSEMAATWKKISKRDAKARCPGNQMNNTKS